MPYLNAADELFIGTQRVVAAYLGSVKVWPPAQGSQPRITSVSPDGSISITWDETPNASSYQIRRNGLLVSTQSSRVFTDTGLNWGASYSYSVTPTVLGILGEESATSDLVQVPKGTTGQLTATNRYHDRVTISWNPVPGATHYGLVINGVTQVVQSATNRVVYTSNNSTFSINVVPIRNSVNGNASPTYNYYSGRAQQTDVGTRQFWIRAIASGSWRTHPSNSWGQSGDHVRQGAFTGSSFGFYRGLIDFGHLGAQNAALAACDGVVARVVNGWTSDSRVTLFKNFGVGTNGGIWLRWAATGIAAGGDPLGYTAGAWQDVFTNGSGQWGSYIVGHANTNVLIKDGLRGICCAYDSNDTSRYGDFSGISAGGDSCDLLVTWNWNYVSVTYRSPTWTAV